MRPFVRFFLMGTAFFAYAFPAHAAELVSVRTGDHTNYSRIVFEWKKLEGYKVERQPDAIIVTFAEGATPPAEKIEAFNILKTEVLSSDPFSVKLSTPPGSEYRSFAAGQKVIIDVYDTAARPRPAPPPPEPAKAGEAKSGEHGKDASADEKAKDAGGKDGHGAAAEGKGTEGEGESKAKKPSDEPELGKIIKPDTVPVKTAKPAEGEGHGDGAATLKDAGSVAKPKDADLNPPEHNKADEASSSAAGKETESITAPSKPPAQTAESPDAKGVPKPNLINVSSTQPVGMAAFESGGQILMVLDAPGLLVRPLVSGANASEIEPVETFPVEKGTGFKAHGLSGTKLRAEGGGLLWSVVVTPETQDLENAPIERKDGTVFVPLKNIRSKLDVIDPQTGALLEAVTVSDSESRVGDARSFVDFDLLASAAGLAVRPKVDGLEVKIVPEGVEITKPGGLVLSSAADIQRAEKALLAAQQKPKEEPKHELENGQVLFDFKDWRMGGLERLNQNRNIVFTDMHGKNKDEQIADLIKLARTHIANGRAAEALGFLRFAEQELPELEQNPEFMALRGISKAFDGKLETALEDLSAPVLEPYAEAKIWKAYVLASLGDWAQAKDTLPDDLTLLKNYTPEVLNRLALVLAEVELRDGNGEIAEELFALVEKDMAEDDLNKSMDAQLQYLKGEAARQKGKIDEAVKLWEPLTKGLDDLYRVKAGLALTRLLVDNKKLDPQQAIDRLERLRYAWRGDELEAQVNYWLGRTYFEAGDPIKGLKILRDAIPIAKDTPLAPRIAGDMTSLYTGYFTAPELAQKNPVDAMALYEEFHELLPNGAEGNKVMTALAERLVAADLLSRGAELMQYQLDHRLSGDEAAHTAVRLAAIYLLDKNPEQALRALNKASTLLKTLPADVGVPARFDEIELLRSRALSQGKHPDQALSVLASMKQGPDVNRLRADIAWQAGYWDDASYALQDVIDDMDIKLTRPLTDTQAGVILQRALALNLSGDRIGLADMREKYTEAMSQTTKAKQFEVVTRARQSAGLADRDTLLSAVSEVDLFKDFLESYKKEAQPSN